jgi:Tol biopolymer transport system component
MEDRIVGNYRVEQRIGGGSAGVVYRALDMRDGRVVALKVLSPAYGDDPGQWKRFQVDGRVAAGLRHHNIVTVYEIGQVEGVSYIAMEYATGGSLEQLLGHGRTVDVATASKIVNEVASALDYAHGRGVVHRDIKPSNVLLRSDGQAVLADFGLAKARDVSRITEPGSIMGTFEYMSPEQCKGLDVDYRSDIYSLGVLCYRLLTGQLPFRQSTRPAQLHAHIYEIPPRPSSVNPRLPRQVDVVLSRALSKAPGARYPSAGEMVRALRAALGQSPTTPVPYRGRRLPASTGTVAVVAVIVVVVAILLAATRRLEISPSEPSPVVVRATYRMVFESRRHGEPELYLMNDDGSGQVRLTNNYVKDWAPAWSPDYTRIAFVSERDGNMEIYVMRPSGSDVVRLTYDAAFDSSPSWSPDGSRIAFDSDRDGDIEIYAMDIDGSNLVQLTHNSVADGDPDWSPDGRQVVFNSLRDGNYEIYVMTIDGGNVTRLTTNEARDSLPVWSPDGKWIAFESDRSGSLDIWIMASDGTDPRRLTSYSGDDQQPSWSPDSREIAFTRHDGPGDVWNVFAVSVDLLKERRITSSSTVESGPDWGGR